MPLSMVSDGESFLIKKIMGKEEVRRFLENLGFGSIVIYRNGNEIINDNPQMNYGNVVSYDLSEYGNGEYMIVITTGYGDIYVGTFDRNIK